MDILSFGLGIAFALVIILMVVLVMGIIKLNRLGKSINELRTGVRDLKNEADKFENNVNCMIDGVHDNYSAGDNELNNIINREIEELNRSVDSKLDKLENRIKK